MSKPMGLKTALRFALGITTGALLLSGGYTYAQEEEEEAKEVEEVIVTGSRIKRSNLDSVKPLEIIDAATIAKTGLNNIGDVLQNITSSDGTGVRPVSTSTNAGDGQNEISLRNLGAGRTLVLVDGRRWVTNAYGVVDMNTIPQSTIERVEILKDGASSIYGSDAIAGVINFITKKDFDGFEVTGMTGQYEAGDGEQNTVNVTWGTSDDRTSTVINLSYASQSEILAGDRKSSSVPYVGCPADSRANTGGDGYCGSSYPANGRFIIPGVGQFALTPGKDGTSVDDFEGWSNASRYNYAPINYLQLPVERKAIYLKSHYDFTDRTTFNFTGTYTKRNATNQIAEVPMVALGSSGPQWEIPISGDNVYNPFGADIPLWGFRSIFAGPRTNEYDYDIFAIRASVDSSFEFNNNEYFWSVGYQYNDAQYDSKISNYINLAHLRNAVGPSYRDPVSGLAVCGTPGSAPIYGCTPFNLFGGPTLGLAQGVITQAEFDAMSSYVSYDGTENSGYQSDDFWAELSGPLFAMPAGDVMFAVGFEKRVGSYYDTPDALVAQGLSSTNFREPTRGETSVDEFFVEVNVPLLMDAPLAKELEMIISGRKSDYSASGKVNGVATSNDPGSPSTYEVGLKWRPVDDLLVRATFGETFRAPAVGDLYLGAGEGFPQANDPCQVDFWAGLSDTVKARCIATGAPDGGSEQPTSQLRSLSGGDPNLLPEQGENMTFGLVYTPEFIDGLSIALDYWAIELEDVIVTLGASTTLGRCYFDGASQDDAFCDLISRDSFGKVNGVRTTKTNSALNTVEGIDLATVYNLQTEKAGNFRFSFDMTYYTKDEYAQSANSTPSESFGWYDGEADFRWRANASVDWMYDAWSVTWNMRFVDDMKDDCWLNVSYAPGFIGVANAPCSNPTATNNFGTLGVQEMDQTTYHDLQVKYSFSENIEIYVGGRNIFGEEPPTVFDTFAHGFDMAWDMPEGGYFYGGFNYRM